MKILTLLFTLFAIAMCVIGCDRPATNAPGASETNSKDHGPDDHEGHDHAEYDHAAPHGGHLIELGRNHEYHAELVDDQKTETITVYLMDSQLKPFKLKASSISLMLTTGNQTETFELQANRNGGSSEFSSADGKMMEMIGREHATGKLRVMIDGKPYNGTFDHHEHDHQEESDSHAAHGQGTHGH